MTFKQDLADHIQALALGAWSEIPEARVSPELASLTLLNTGKHLDACFLYADIHRSTELVDTATDTLAAEYYKAFLFCAGQIMRRNNGSIEAYDGDRVMAVFVGDLKEDQAVNAALELHYAVNEIINPQFAFYGELHKPLRHTVGIDSGQVLVAKAGVRKSNDLVGSARRPTTQPS